MRVPYQRNATVAKNRIYKFKGLDLREKASDEYFKGMQNMSTDEKNCAMSRGPRGKIDLDTTEIYSMVSTDIVLNGVLRENAFIIATKETLVACYEDNGVSKSVDIMNTTTFTTRKNKMIASGGYLYFFPDKKYINLMDIRDSGSLDCTVTLNGGVYTLGDETNFYEIEFTSTDENGINSLSGSGYTRITCKKYRYTNGAQGSYVSDRFLTVYMNRGDVVKISGTGDSDGYYKIASISSDNTYIVVEGELPEVKMTTGVVSIVREIPDMDYVVAAGNRLWGCRYGVNEDKQPVNCIYACKLGDPKNWNSFNGVSTDSYAASVGADGAFTGAAVYEGDPVFFKEDCCIRVYGSYPADFTLITNNIQGIEKGSSESAVVIDGILYYKSYNGIVAYSGGFPRKIDEALGDEEYSGAAAGNRGGKYYVSMKNSKGNYELFVYDILNNVWCKEDALKVRNFCRCGDELYMLVGDEGEPIVYSVCGSGGADHETEVIWQCESGELGHYKDYRKYVTKLEVRLKLEGDAAVDGFISYDGGSWKKVFSAVGKARRITSRITPVRCDSYRLRFRGKGHCKILSVTVSEAACGDNSEEVQ